MAVIEPRGAAFISAMLFWCSGLALFVALLTRLLAVDHFGGDPLTLNFGQKTSSSSTTNITSAGDNDNIAFGLEFNSFGHMLQGMLVFFIPSVIPQAWPIVVALLGQLLGLGCIIYPLYNGMKRIISGGLEFARSSYCNNATEWVVGFIIGGFLSALLIVILHCTSIKRHSRTAKVLPWVEKFPVRIFHVQLVAGGIQCLAVLIAMIMFAVSWNHESPEQDVAGAVLVVVFPLVVVLAFVAGASFWYMKCGKKDEDSEHWG